MSTSETYADRRFYRSADRALLGGVCAGVADYFGFNLRVLRIMAVIAFVLAMPVVTIAYLAAVFLIPARSARSGNDYSHYRNERGRAEKTCSKRERRRARREARHQQDAGPSEAAMEVRDKCKSLDQRIVELEKIITSSSYQLDREIRNL